MSSKKNDEFSFEISLKVKAAGILEFRSIQGSLFPKPGIQIPKDFLQNIDREIQFLWQYCPFRTEGEFTELLLNYFFSETRIPNSHGFPFNKVHLVLPSRTYSIDKFRYALQPEKTKFGLVDSLLVTADFGAYRLRIGPGFRIPPHVHHVMKEKEIILTQGLLLDGKNIPAGTVKVWPHRIPHCYENHTSTEQSILCIDQPPFDANDEVLV